MNSMNYLEIDKEDSNLLEEKLKKFEKKYQFISDNLSVLITMLNDKFEFEYFNENVHKKLLGYRYSNLINKSFLNIVHPDDLKKLVKFLKKCTKHFDECQEIRIKHKKGNFVWVEIEAKKFTDENNQKMFLVFLKDINKYKNLEKELREKEKKIKNLSNNIPEIRFWNLFNPKEYQEAIHSSNNMLHNIIESVPQYIFWKDLNLVYLGCNSNYAKFIGFIDPMDIINKKDKDVLTNKENVSKLHEQELKVINSNIAEYHHEDIWEFHNGKKIWLDINRIPLHDSKGNVIGTLVSYEDITFRKKTEEELIKLNNLKSELLTRASHELKTPLMSIKGFTDLLLLKYEPILHDDELFLVKEIKKGCSRLERLVKDVLKTADLETGLIELKKSKNDLSTVIKDCVADLNKFADSRNHTIKLNLHDRMITYFDKEQIQDLIGNILTNAIKYTPPTGKIEIKSEKQNNFFIISIKDNGIGLIEEEKDILFTRFGKIERFGHGFDVITEGSGLGLYTAKRIIKLHGGEMWVKSDGRKKGSTFYFSLPLQEFQEFM